MPLNTTVSIPLPMIAWLNRSLWLCSWKRSLARDTSGRSSLMAHTSWRDRVVAPYPSRFGMCGLEQSECQTGIKGPPVSRQKGLFAGIGGTIRYDDGIADIILVEQVIDFEVEFRKSNIRIVRK